MFDYQALDANTRDRLALCARKIRPQMYRAAVEMIALGKGLAKVKELLGHARFGQWMLHEFVWGQDVTWRYLMSARQFGGSPLTLETACLALNTLVAPTASEAACFEALVRHSLGQAMTCEVLRNIIIRSRAQGLTVEDLAELTGIEVAPEEADEEAEEDEDCSEE